LTTGNLTAANALTLDSQGSVTTGDLSAQTVTVTAGHDTTVGNVQASGSATFTAGGLASFLGVVSSPTITVTSGDLDMVDGASLGVFGVTNLLTLNAVSNGQPILIGGDNAPDGQYHLGSDGELIAKQIVINADGDVHIFDVEIEGSATSGGGVSQVTLNSEGTVLVNGIIDFTGAGNEDSLSIKAADRIKVNTDTGGIQMTDNDGNLAGTLNLTAQDIWVASGDVLTQLQADPNFSGRDQALATNSGTPNQDGFLRAGAVKAVVGQSLLVQNSGTPDLFGGIDTGDGGLSIETVGSEPATVVAFGRQTNSDGTVITNQDFLENVELTGESGFTDDSIVNGCSLGGNCSQGEQAPPPGIDMASILGPLDQTNSPDDQDKQQDEEDADESDDGSSVDPSLRLINTTPINLDQQIDDPVTSGGDVVVGGPQ
jgi:hypothetical protein